MSTLNCSMLRQVVAKVMEVLDNQEDELDVEELENLKEETIEAVYKIFDKGCKFIRYL